LLNYLSRKGNDLIGRGARWWEKMHRLDLTIKYIEGKDNIVADVLSRTGRINTLVSLSSGGELLIQDQQHCPEIGVFWSYFTADGALDRKQRSLAENLSFINGCIYHLWSPHPGAQRTKTVTQLVVL
jgi:hypothetical protein